MNALSHILCSQKNIYSATLYLLQRRRSEVVRDNRKMAVKKDGKAEKQKQNKTGNSNNLERGVHIANSAS